MLQSFKHYLEVLKKLYNRIVGETGQKISNSIWVLLSSDGICKRYFDASFDHLKSKFQMFQNYWEFFRENFWKLFQSFSANTYLFKVNNRNNRKRWEMCSKLTIKTIKSDIILVSLLLIWIYFTTLTVCSYHVTYAFQSESTLYSCLNAKELLLETGAKSEISVTATGLEPITTEFVNEHWLVVGSSPVALHNFV